MGPLFELTDLAAYLQQDLDTSTATVCRDVATAIILEAAGKEPVSVPPSWRAVGLAVAARVYANPTSLQSEGLGSYTTVYARQGVELTPTERAQILAAVGVGGAFTISPAVQPAQF